MKLSKESANFHLYILSLLICTLFANLSTSIPCGDRLTSPTGVIHTPGFPGSFEVPIKCRWVIDLSDIASTNGSIVVYLSQLYVYKGLKFTEYAYYESESMNFGASVIKEVTEGNVFKHKWIRTFRSFLVIDFELERLEGNHVRVLHDLLDVYGFNVSYTFTEEDVNSNSCSLQECSFTGNCLISADFLMFSCTCFDGFYGRNCNEGPLCFDDEHNPVCLNGGTCRQIGAEAMQCDCPPGYVGQKCQIRLLNSKDNECATENCILQCSLEDDDQPCNCKNATKIYNNRSRYECRIKLFNVTSLQSGLIAQHGNLETFVARQLTKYLRNSNISSMEDLKILSVTPTSEVTFHFFGNSDDGDRIREALNRLVQRRRLNEITLESTHFTFQQKPALRLQSLRLNRANNHEVHLGEQFVLSCAAQGSYSVNFFWYKDGMLVNTSKATREIWYRTVLNDGADTRTSYLTINEATSLDTGQYTCQAVDWGVQQCKSIYIEVRDEPDVKVVPMSATIEKGHDIQLTCTTPNMRSIGIGFGWTKNRALLKLEPGSEVWEDLYPAGSVLKITNAQKSAIYTCNVAHRSMSVRVEVMNRTLIPICSKDKSWNLQWPDTTPGSEALLECPRNFVGQRVPRLCSMKDATTPEWQIPDFSSCLYNPFLLPYNRFQSLTLGYENTSGSETINTFWNILRSRELPLYPGEGDRIVDILAKIEHYQSHANLFDLYHSSEALVRIANRILDDENSILSQQKLLTLLQLVERNLIYMSEELEQAYKHLSLSSMVVDIQRLHFLNADSITHSLEVPSESFTYPNWYSDKVAIRLWRKKQQRGKFNNGTLTGFVVVYKNVSRFLPTAYIKELDNGTDLEYRINSRVITVSLPNFVLDKHNKIWIDLQIKHLRNQSTAWNVSCGLLNSGGSWDLESCIVNMLTDDITTHCICPRTGTIAIFLKARAVRVVLAKREQTTFIVVFGCASCLLQCLFSSLILGSFWWKDRNWLNFLKLQCCGAVIGAMAIFIYAVRNDIPESSFSLAAISLEAFLLMAMSAPVSEALIIYAELTHIRPSQHLQSTIIGVITGVPVLAVSATELAHQSTGWRHESWWLIYGSGVYNIFVTCTSMMFLIFMILYMGVLHKARVLVEENVMKRETIETRIRLLHRAAIIICGIIAMEASSIFYINSASIIFHYVFASLCSALGFIIIIMYIITGEVKIIATILQKFKWKADESREPVSEPIKVCSKTSGEAENDMAPPVPLISGESYLTATRGIAAGSIDMREFMNESSSYSKPSVPAASRFLPEIRIDHSDDINLENYSTSPRKYQDMSVPCRGYHDFSKYHEVVVPRQPLQNPECSGKVLCSADIESRLSAMPDVTLAVKSDIEHMTPVELKNRDVNVIPDIANTSERKQPDGEEKAPEITLTDCETTTTGMLDRISHDLDYLLNRTHAKESL